MTLVLDPMTLPPAIKGWLGAHVALRRDADALVAAVNALEPADYVGAGRLADAFAVTRRCCTSTTRPKTSSSSPSSSSGPRPSPAS